MPTFQYLLHTSGVCTDPEDEDQLPIMGFYSTRRVSAKDTDQAYELVMAAMDADPKLSGLIQAGHDSGLRPKTEVEEVYLIPWWRAILPWRQPGLIFYQDEEDEDSIEPPPDKKTKSEQGADGDAEEAV